ncbi:hypothetical protein HOY80DRAFT_1058067 [Tuber brumale]|nr:hypothetical protein HOY80DRAFT_1058067 [Tuber brumale]
MSDSPPPKRHCSPSMKSFTTYYPTKKYAAHVSHSSSYSTVSYCYPLSLLPLATIRIYQSREFTPLKAPCRKCGHPTKIGRILQKIFLTVERLVGVRAGKLDEKEKNEENHWAVNYEAGIPEPVLFGGGGFKSRRLADNPYFPFEGERGVEELGSFIRSLHGIVLGGGDDGGGTVKGKEVEAQLATPRKLSMVPCRATPPASSPHIFSQTFMSPPPSRHPETPAGTPEEEGTIPDFNDLTVLFSLLDKLERGSFAAAHLMDAFADVVIGQRCGKNNCDQTLQNPGAKASPVPSGIVGSEGEVDSENDDDRSSGTVYAEQTPREHTPSAVGWEKGPVFQNTPGEDSSPPASVCGPTTKRRGRVIRNPRTPKPGNRATPEGPVPVQNRWYASITPKAERRIRLENPGEDVRAMIKEGDD